MSPRQQLCFLTRRDGRVDVRPCPPEHKPMKRKPAPGKARKPPAQRELPLKTTGQKFPRPPLGPKTCAKKRLVEEAALYCKRSGHPSARGQDRCVKLVVDYLQKNLKACKP